MRTLNLVQAAGADVAMPQAVAFTRFACQFRALSAIVNSGRTQAAFTSQKGAAQSTLPENKWSRGCRALRSPFLHCAWLPSWQLAPRKSKTWFTSTSRPSRSSRRTLASTSNTIGRALWAATARPALFLSAVRAAAVGRAAVGQVVDAASANLLLVSRYRFVLAAGLAYGARICKDTIWRLTCVPQPSLLSSRLPLSPLAPRKKPLLSRCRLTSLSSRPKPANTSKLTGRAGAVRPASATPLWEVASC